MLDLKAESNAREHGHEHEHRGLSQLAYQSWLERGSPSGSPAVDWEYACQIVNERMQHELRAVVDNRKHADVLSIVDTIESFREVPSAAEILSVTQNETPLEIPVDSPQEIPPPPNPLPVAPPTKDAVPLNITATRAFA